MDRCEDMAKKRNLEAIPGKETFPTVLNTPVSFLSHITACVGVSLGKTVEEAENTASMIKQLEQARYNLFLADARKESSKDPVSGSKLDSFDPKAIQGLHSDDDGESMNDEDTEFDATVKLMASLCKSRYRSSYSGFSVKPKVRTVQ